MIYIVVDPKEKNIVRAAYEMPESMTFAEAEKFIKEAYQWESTGEVDSAIDYLEENFFSSVAWQSVEL